MTHECHCGVLGGNMRTLKEPNEVLFFANYMPTRYFWAAIAAVSLAIAACSDETAAVSELAAGVSFAVKPATMRSCDDPVVATLTWKVDVEGVKEIKIFAVEDKTAAPVLFTHAGTSGTAETGPWARAGHAFILKDAGETRQLGKLFIESTGC